MKDVKINEFDRNIVYERKSWHRSIHVADST